jgi:hypothetical protein
VAMVRIIYLHGYYSATASKEPNLKQGEIYERNVQHGTIVYLIKTEDEQFKFTETILGISVAIIFLTASFQAYLKRNEKKSIFNGFTYKVGK